jgi:hypothetical protein
MTPAVAGMGSLAARLAYTASMCVGGVIQVQHGAGRGGDGDDGGRLHPGQRVVGPGLGERQHAADVRRSGIALGQVPQVPPLLHRGQQRRVVVRRAALGGAVNRARGDQRGDEDGRDPDPEAPEVEPEPVGGGRADVRRGRALRRRDMVVAPAVLVVGDDEQRAVPVLAVTAGPVDVADESLTRRHVVRRALAAALLPQSGSRKLNAGSVPTAASCWKSAKWAKFAGGADRVSGKSIWVSGAFV